MTLSFSSFCERLGVPLHNKYWSWCAMSERDRMAVFTVWEDRIEDGRYIFTTKARAGENPNKPGRKELNFVLGEVVENGFAAYGIQCKAADVNAMPRKRKSFINDRLLDLRIFRREDEFHAQIVGHIPPSVVASRGDQSTWLASTAINDIDQQDIGNNDPEYRRRMSGRYIRDERVRSAVLRRANGHCEFCHELGFRKTDGRFYLETHHVISLSEQGADRLDNVIALCANDHRRAHFSSVWVDLQIQFTAILKSLAAD